MTPAAVLATIPDGLLLRRTGPTAQLENAKALAVWLAERGHRPSWAEIEAERARRTTNQPDIGLVPPNERTHRRKVTRQRGTTTNRSTTS